MITSSRHPHSPRMPVWNWLTRPHNTLTDGEAQRKSALLATMLIITLIVGTILVAIVLLIEPSQIRAPDVQAIIFGLFCLPIIYGLNRAGRLQWASALYVFATYIVFALPVYGKGAGATSMSFAGISLLVGAIFLATRTFTIFALLGNLFIGFMIAININNPLSSVYTSGVDYFAAWFFLIMMAFLINTFVLYLRTTEATRRRELEDANEQLRISEASLERRVEARTRDLEIARKQAEEANLVKSQFLASTSHELRTPLNAIINFGEFFEQGLLGEVSDEQIEAAGYIVSSGRHLLALINDVLDISKIEAGALQLYIEDNVNLHDELHDLLKTTHTLLQSKQVAAHLDIPDGLPTVRGDRLRIRQILLNLISNACKFTEHGTVTLHAHQDHDKVVMSVSDTGPGIQEQDMEKIFETFRQTEVGIRKGSGTGLGLPIARRLAEAHGGSLTVSSVYGQGAVFTVTLPIQSNTLVVADV